MGRGWGSHRNHLLGSSATSSLAFPALIPLFQACPRDCTFSSGEDLNRGPVARRRGRRGASQTRFSTTSKVPLIEPLPSAFCHRFLIEIAASVGTHSHAGSQCTRATMGACFICILRSVLLRQSFIRAVSIPSLGTNFRVICKFRWPEAEEVVWGAGSSAKGWRARR